MLDADRQFDRDDAEAVAELDVARLTQVDRHHRPAFHPLGLVAAVGKVATHRPGDAGQRMSLIEHPSARLTALTSGSSSGSHQATRFVPPASP